MDLFDDLHSLEGRRRRIWLSESESLPLLLSGLWYSVHGEKPTLFRAFSEDPLKYSADEAGDSSGVSSRGRSSALREKAVRLAFESLVELSLGGVGGRAVIVASPEAKLTMIDLGQRNCH